MVQTFNRGLDARLSKLGMRPDVQQAIDSQRAKLAQVEIPSDLDPVTKKQIGDAIASSFVSGFRWVVFIAGALAIAASVSALIWIEDPTSEASP